MPWRIRNRGQYMILRRALGPNNAWVAEEPDAGVIGFLTLQLPQDYIDHLFVATDWLKPSFTATTITLKDGAAPNGAVRAVRE